MKTIKKKRPSHLKNKKKPRNIKRPPVSGTLDFAANFWCMSPVSLVSNLLWSKALLMSKTNTVKASK